jgi:hypothetical protein
MGEAYICGATDMDDEILKHESITNNSQSLRCSFDVG